MIGSGVYVVILMALIGVIIDLSVKIRRDEKMARIMQELEQEKRKDWNNAWL